MKKMENKIFEILAITLSVIITVVIWYKVIKEMFNN